MKIKPSLSVRQQQKLSPRLYQSLKILRPDAAALQELIRKELYENPVLEIPEPADFDTGSPPGPALWRDYEMAARQTGSRSMRTGRPAAGPAELAASPVTLADHLTLQLDLARLSPARRRLGLAIIGSLDGDGYLRDPLRDVARAGGGTAAETRKVLRIVQEFDPPGVAARNLEECLMIQLKQMGAGKTALAIAEKHLGQVARGASRDIARELGAPAGRVEKAIALIRSLSPSPGSLFDASPPAAAVIPDVFIQVSQGRVQVLANPELTPALKVNPIYKNMAGAAEAATRDFIKSRLASAGRLIRDVNKRRTTLIKVSRAIAKAQPAFFDSGPEYLKPLTLDRIAAALGVHPSTVSRAIMGKYMSTPFGVFEFSYFFSAGYAAAGGNLAASAIKKRLVSLIAGEDSRRPFSDQRLADLLKKEYISISRRTVAKYRQQAAILPASQRRK